MPTPLAHLERDLARALEARDAERVSAVRRLILEQHPETEAASESAFRLGLEALFTQLDLDQAADHLRAATKVKGSRFAHPARVSLGLALFRQGKVQQAVFELRKAAGQKPPTLAAAQALGFIAAIQRQVGPPADLERTRADMMKTLEGLTQTAPRPEAALAHLLLASEHKSDGRRDLAKKHVQAALDSGGLEPDYADRAKALLLDVS